MSNREQPGEPEPDQPDQVDKPYGELGFATQTYLTYIATGRFDPSTLSREDLSTLDIIAMKMHADLMYLLEHGEPAPDFGLPPELRQRLEDEGHTDTPPPLDTRE